MADPSGSIALPSETATFSRISSTKLSLRIDVPSPAIIASFSRNGPTNSIVSAGLPTKLSPNSAPIIASSPSSSLTELSPTDTLPPLSSTTSSLGSSPTKISPTAALFPSTSSPIDDLPSYSNAILSPGTISSSNTTSTKLSPINLLPPFTSAPAKLSLGPALPHSPNTATFSTSDITINVSPTATIAPSNRSPAELSPTDALPPFSNVVLSPSTIPPSNITPTNLLPITPLSLSTSAPATLPHSPSTATSSSNDITINVPDLQCCIHDVMSALIEKGHKRRFVKRGHKLNEKNRLVESGNKLKDTVQHVSSDFSRVFGSISEGERIISDQKSCSTMLHGQGHSMASEIIKDVANIHWAAIGLLTIANVLERFDKISVNDRDCFDLLEVMLDLAKVLKQLKDNSFDLHKEIAEKMVDALWLISSGAKLCRTFIAQKKTLKFFLTKKIRDDLKYIRRKMDIVTVQLNLQIQIKHASFNNSRRQSYSDGAGGSPSEQETTTNENVHAGGLSSEQSTTTTDEIVQCKAEDAAPLTETCAAGSRIDMCTTINTKIVSRVNGGDSDEAVSCKEINKVDRRQKSKRRLFRFPGCFKKLKERRSQKQIKQKPAKKVVVGISLDKRELSSFSIEDGCGGIPTIHFTIEELHNATNGFQHQLKSSHVRFNMFKGTLSSGRQVIVKKFPSQEASSSEQDSTKIMLNELSCMLRLKHKNIARLMGFCNIEKEDPMLVYDYPRNGNLYDFLSDGKREGDSKKKKAFDWSARSKIILGVINALIYLHETADDHMYWVHANIKPENILLYGNFNAKLSDFSLAKAFSFDDSSSGDRRILSSEVDIYSFGILLLQIISGRESLPRQDKDDALDLRMKAWRLYKEERLHELIDSELLERDGCEFTGIVRSIKVALWCMVTDPSLRPNTSKVSVMLSTDDEIPSLPDDCISMEPHFVECHQSQESDGSVRSVEGAHSEVRIVVEPRA